MEHNNQMRTLNYKGGYAVLTKGCTTITIATIHQPGISGTHYHTTSGKIFTFPQILVQARYNIEGNQTVDLIQTRAAR